MNTRFAFLFLRFALGLVLLCSLVLGDVSPASAAPLRCYVDADATTGGNTGGSWTDAYTDLQSALGTSLCTEVWVAAGTYKPTGTTDRTISFVLKSGVAIYGGFAGTETLLSQRNPVANPTILSGEIGAAGNADNSYHVVVGSSTDSTARLDGFTITAGNADGIVSPDYWGGGILNSAGSPSLANLTFSSNSAGCGAGIYNLSSSPSLADVTFSGNSVTQSGGGMNNTSGSNPSLVNVTFSNNSAGSGGGMENDSSSPSLTNVTFNGNSAYALGGGMSNSDSSPSLANVTFSGNSAMSGGGMWNWVSSSPNLVDVAFSGNSATTGGGMHNREGSPNLVNVTFSGNSAGRGGGMYNEDSSPILKNVTLSGNSAVQLGGGMYNSGGSPSLTNVTFSSNSATTGGGMHNDYSSNPMITNSILYGDTGGEIFSYLSSPTVSYSIVQGGYAGTGNMDADPLLGPLADNGGFTQTRALGFGSPAIDRGTNTGCPLEDQRGLARPQGPRCDMGAYEYPQGELNLFSAGAQDGWVLESSELSNRGGTRNATAATFNLGDDATDKQYRSILSFNTSGLPDTAVITKATLMIKRQGMVGTNPFNTHSGLKVDIRKPYFGAAAGLAISDFQAFANKAAVATFNKTPAAGAWYSAVLSGTAYPYINLKGTTQFRLRFAKDDNDDLSADYLKFYSGNAGSAYRPVLVIEYSVP